VKKGAGDQRTIRLVLRFALVCGALTCGVYTAVAEEGRSGHYFPGSMADIADAVPLKPAFIVRYNQIYYSGSLSANKKPIAGVAAFGVHATLWGEGITVLWRPPLDVGERWSYAMSATVPFLQMRVDASAVAPIRGGRIISRSSSLGYLGDLIVMPLILNYNINHSLNVNFRLGEYLPTGNYQVGRLANTGKNFITTEPTFALMYLGPKNRREADFFVGFDFNTENSTTNYQTGTQFHMEGTLAQRLPLGKGLFGIGVTSFYYQQLTGDSGSGATFGEFKGSSVGVGPLASYVKKGKKVNILGNLKWLPEVYTKNRLQGNIAFLKVIFRF
jgi:hypothetical protein